MGRNRQVLQRQIGQFDQEPLEFVDEEEVRSRGRPLEAARARMDCNVSSRNPTYSFSFAASSRIPSDFPWPKFDRAASPRPALTTITNRSTNKRSSREHTASTVKAEPELPIVNSDSNHHHFFTTTDYSNVHVASPHHLTTVHHQVNPHAHGNSSEVEMRWILTRHWCVLARPVFQ